MKTSRSVRHAIILTILVPAAATSYAGPLTPPPGAIGTNGLPVGYMKTLNEVEPRRHISAIPYTITNSGSYFLTENLRATDHTVNGITVLTNDVRIDLNGFSLLGDKAKGGNDGAAVWVNPGYMNVCVRNGVTRDWNKGGLYALGTYDGRIEKVICHDNGSVNYNDIQTGKEWVVADCASYTSGSNGIALQPASVVKDCMVFNAAASGIDASIQCHIRKCLAYGNTVAGILVNEGCTVTDCSPLQNKGHGIQANTNNRIQNNSCVDNGKDGSSSGIYVTGTGNRIEGNSINGGQLGIAIDGTNNFTVKNTTVDCSKGYAIQDGNHTGRVMVGDDLPEPFSEVSPWANFDL